jgi:hypothetical protein
LTVTLGTNQNRMDQFLGSISNLSVETHLSSQEIIGLSSAFRDVGIPLQSTTKNWQDLVIVAGKSQTVMGLSNETTAEFIRSMTASGAGVQEVKGAMDSLYAITQMTNRSIQEINVSMREGQSLFEAYGGVSHENMANFSKDVLGIRSLFSAVNIDAKNASGYMAAMLDNPMLRARHSALLAGVLGGNQADMFAQMGTKRGVTNDLQAGISLMGRRMGPNAAMLGMSQDEIVKRYGSGGYERFVMQQNAAMKSLAGQGFNPQMLQQGLADFAASAQSQIPNVDKRIQSLNGNLGEAARRWIEIREAQQKSTAPATSVEKAFQNVSATLPEMTKQVSLLGQQVMVILGLPLMKLLTPLLQTVNGFLTPISTFVSKNSELVGSITDIGLSAFAAFNAFSRWGKLLTWVPRIAGPLIGVISELGTGLAALGGGALAEGGILAAVAGTGGTIVLAGAIAAGVAVIWKMFGPQISKAVGDLTSNIVRAATDAWTALTTGVKDLIDQIWNGLKSLIPGFGGGSAGAKGSGGGGASPISDDMASGLISAVRHAREVHQAQSSLVQQAASPAAVVKQASMVASIMAATQKSNVVPMAGAPSSQAGWLSAKYESGRPGTIGDGTFDKHGVRHWAYGAWQMDHVAGTPNKFVNSLQQSAPDIYGRLSPLLGSTSQGRGGAFGQMWQSIAGEDPTRFKDLQKKFMMQNYLQPLISKYGSAMSSPAVQEAMFSTAVHHGVGGAKSLANRAGIGHVNNEDFLSRLYEQRDKTTSGRFHNRFTHESNDAITALLQEQNSLLKQQLAVHKEDADNRKDMHQNLKQQAASKNPVVDMHQNLLYEGVV